MPGYAHLLIAILGISHMCLIECSRQGILILRDNDKMDMISHEAIDYDR